MATSSSTTFGLTTAVAGGAPRVSPAAPGASLTLAGGGASGVDGAGGRLALESGASSGSGPAQVAIRVADRGASGSAANALRDRVLVPTARAMTPTSGARTALFTLTLPVGAAAGAHVDWVVTMASTNGTDLGVVAARSTLTAANVSGTASQSTSDGLLAVQVTQGLAVVAVSSSATVAGGAVTFGLTPTLTLFSAASMRAEFTVHLAGGGTLAFA